jgi:hypothetical protein
MSNTRQHISPALARDVSQLLSETSLDELPVKPQKVNRLLELLLVRIKTLPSWEKCPLKDGTLVKLIKLLLVLAASNAAISSVTLVQLGVPASEINLWVGCLMGRKGMKEGGWDETRTIFRCRKPRRIRIVPRNIFRGFGIGV